MYFASGNDWYMRGSERPFLCGSVGILHVFFTPGSGVILHAVVWYVRVVPVVFHTWFWRQVVVYFVSGIDGIYPWF